MVLPDHLQGTGFADSKSDFSSVLETMPGSVLDELADDEEKSIVVPPRVVAKVVAAENDTFGGKTDGLRNFA